jgi:5-formyltetrahydrofolate cyclo-ligase
MENKISLRNTALSLRNSISSEERAGKSKIIARKLEDLDVFKKAKHILFYFSIGSEVSTIPIIGDWSDKKRLYLPKLINESEFIALPFRGFERLKKGAYGIPEPDFQDKSGPFRGDLDLIIVPGVAFDKNGSRLGMGKGFYDRYLAKLDSVPGIGLAFEEQILADIPKEPYDKPVDILITDKNIYYLKK